jgi:AcrR family transcriptional regulator
VTAPSFPVRARRADARRNIEAIVEAAARTLAENPRAAMQDIAEEAGVHRATVHRHFATRDELIDAVREHAIDDSARALGEVMQGPEASVGDQLHALIYAILETGDRFRLYRYTTWQDDSVADRVAEMYTVIHALLQRAQDAGVLRADVSVDRLHTALGGLLWALGPHIASGAMTFDEGASFIATMLGPSSQPEGT